MRHLRYQRHSSKANSPQEEATSRQGKGTEHGPISNLSDEEQARFAELADIALHNPKPDSTTQPAGTRAKRDHRRLEEELQDALDRFDQDKKEVA